MKVDYKYNDRKIIVPLKETNSEGYLANTSELMTMNELSNGLVDLLVTLTHGEASKSVGCHWLQKHDTVKCRITKETENILTSMFSDLIVIV